MTFATEAAKQAQDWVAIIKIEGVGERQTTSTDADGDGQWLFCTGIPSGETAAVKAMTIWKPYLEEFPDVLSERADLLGGLAKQGGISFGIVDVNDELTEKLRTDAGAATALSAALGTTGNPAFHDSGRAGTDVVFVGAEALRYDTGSTWDRGWLGTTAQSHSVDDEVFLYTPNIRGRRCLLYLCPADGTLSDKELFGEYVLGPPSWDSKLNVWRFDGRSQLKYLDRMAPYAKPYSYRVGSIGEGKLILESLSDGVVEPKDVFEVAAEDDLFLKSGDEIMSVNIESGFTMEMSRRDALRKGVEGFEPGHVARQVFVASENLDSSFRWSKGPSPATSWTSGTWTKSSHFLNIIANIMMSQAHEDDAGGVSNYNSTYGNYACLPAGYGLGMPHTLVDWDAFEAVRERTQGYVFNDFVYGHDSVPFGELINEEFLRPIGAYIVTAGGEFRVVLPRIPLSGSQSVTLGSADVLTRSVGARTREPELELSQRQDKVVSAVIFNVGEDQYVFSNAHFEGLYGQRGFYAYDGAPIKMTINSVRGIDTGFLEDIASARLFRFHRPTFDVSMAVGLDQYGLHPGDIVALTLDELPDLNKATRGWSSMIMEIMERELRFSRELGVHIMIRATGYSPSAKVGKIAPSAYVTSVVTNTATVEANRYTDSTSSGLPVADNLAFAVGDVVQLTDRDGASLASGATETVVSLPTNQIELSGNFSGALASSRIITYATYADSLAVQTATRVYLADRTGDFDIGASGEVPWVYGEK